MTTLTSRLGSFGAKQSWTVTLVSDIEPTEIITVRASTRYTALRLAQIDLEARIGERVENYRASRIRLGMPGWMFYAHMLAHEAVMDAARAAERQSDHG